MSKVDQLKLFACFMGSTLKPDLPWLWFSRSQKAKETPKANKIAYLDGVKGVSAMLVYLTHHAMYAHQNAALHRAFGWRGEYYLAAFPGIRLLWSGGAFATAMFFIISGYVCSLSSISSLHKGQLEKMAKNLGTGLPRRFFRLYFPVCFVTLIIVTAWHLFEVRSSNNATPPPQANYLLELRSWLSDVFRLSFVWIKEGQAVFDPINPHLWYIPAQFRGMLVINAVLWCTLAFHHWGNAARLCSVCVPIAYFLFAVDGWSHAMCVMGVLACDLDLLAEKNMLPIPRSLLDFFASKRWTWNLLFIAGLWIAGAPRGVEDIDSISENDPGWGYLIQLTPRQIIHPAWFWEFWAATFMLFAIPRIHWLRSCFEMSIPLYLGKVSFGLYLVHGPILWTVGARVYAACGFLNSVAAQHIPDWWINLLPLPTWGPMGLEVNYVVAQAMLLPLTLWLAGIVHKLLDEPSGRIANWLFDPKRYDRPLPSERPLLERVSQA